MELTAEQQAQYGEWVIGKLNQFAEAVSRESRTNVRGLSLQAFGLSPKNALLPSEYSLAGVSIHQPQNPVWPLTSNLNR